MIFALWNAENATNVYHRTCMQKIKGTPKRISSRKPPSNTGDTVSAATWRHQWNMLPQVAPTPRVKWLTMATERSSSDRDVDLDSQIDRFDYFYFGDNGAVGVAVAAVELHVGVSGSLRWDILVGIAPFFSLIVSCIPYSTVDIHRSHRESHNVRRKWR